MADGKAEAKIAKPPDEVWALVGDFGGLDEWMPGIEACELDGDVRKLQTMGMEIHEQLKERDDDARTHLVLDREVTDAARAPPRDDHASPKTATARSSRGRTRCDPTRWPARSARSTKARCRRSRRSFEG